MRRRPLRSTQSRDAAGNIVCNVTITNPGLYPGCVPLNPFGPTSDSMAALELLH